VYKIFIILYCTFFFISCKSDDRIEEPGICLSFDDRYIVEWFNMRKLFKKYDARVTFFVTQMDSLNSDEISQLHTLQDDGHEIASHGAMHVLAETYIQKESYRSYLKNEIEASINSMKSKGFNPRSFAYPYGSNYWFTDYLVLKKFDKIRSVTVINNNENINECEEIFIKYRDQNLYDALGIDLNSKLDSSDIDLAFDRIIQNKEILILFGHAPMDTSGSIYRFNMELLEYILYGTQKNNLKFYRFDEL